MISFTIFAEGSSRGTRLPLGGSRAQFAFRMSYNLRSVVGLISAGQDLSRQAIADFLLELNVALGKPVDEPSRPD